MRVLMIVLSFSLVINVFILLQVIHLYCSSKVTFLLSLISAQATVLVISIVQLACYALDVSPQEKSLALYGLVPLMVLLHAAVTLWVLFARRPGRHGRI
jgi:hypothetical protein